MTQLAEFRQAASQASGGRSHDGIRRLVLRLLERHGAAGALLDFGAGRGDLLTDLAGDARFHRLGGVDLYPRDERVPAAVEWWTTDLNEPLPVPDGWDVVVCSEVIEHLENPRQTFRTIASLLRPGGLLVLTMPNQESIRSLLALALRGHFVQFLDSNYPQHITALVAKDLERICAEAGFQPPTFVYSDDGAVPALTHVSWQRLTLGLAGGRAFSDNVGMAARRRA